MDSINSVFLNALRKKFKLSKLFGFSKKTDNKKLMVLGYLYYLKYKSSFPYSYNIDSNQYSIDYKNDSKINKKFVDIYNCLYSGSCVIEHMPIHFEHFNYDQINNEIVGINEHDGIGFMILGVNFIVDGLI